MLFTRFHDQLITLHRRSSVVSPPVPINFPATVSHRPPPPPPPSEMNSAATCFRSPPPSILPPLPPPSNSSNPNPNHLQYKPHHSKSLSISIKSPQITAPTHTTPPQRPYISPPLTVTEKLNILVSEFKSLPEPIERVKRLLHYATLLPELDDSGRVEANRVAGCTAQVWLQVAVDDDGSMRFRVDSDSEITKGFCYCLIWLLDGASAGDVVGIRVDDLREMNVGVLVSSRVNTWHNVLISMQRRTRDFIRF